MKNARRWTAIRHDGREKVYHMTLLSKPQTFKQSPRWIMSVRDLPHNEEAARFKAVWPDGEERLITLNGRMRQAVEAMQTGPIYCASPVRLSDAVFRATGAVGRPLHDRDTTDEGRFFYHLAASVERIEGGGT